MVARVRHMYAAMHKISTQLLHRTKCRIIVWEQPVVIAVALSGRGPRGDAMFRNWMRLTNEVVMLGFETQRVIGLRLVRLSRGGPAAESEALRMVTEKTTALAEAGMTLARGGSAGKVIRRYRTHVRANKRRLLKS
jgi:hypothetical protein